MGESISRFNRQMLISSSGYPEGRIMETLFFNLKIIPCTYTLWLDSNNYYQYYK